ncbi:MAG: hypothetical protein SGPRY_012368, partial [Prymnesium sp.]
GELPCVWRKLFWSSIVGSCFGEPTHGDAFDTLMAVLRRRLIPAALRRYLAQSGSVCDEATLLNHLQARGSRAQNVAAAWLSPGAGLTSHG